MRLHFLQRTQIQDYQRFRIWEIMVQTFTKYIWTDFINYFFSSALKRKYNTFRIGALQICTVFISLIAEEIGSHTML